MVSRGSNAGAGPKAVQGGPSLLGAGAVAGDANTMDGDPLAAHGVLHPVSLARPRALPEHTESRDTLLTGVVRRIDQALSTAASDYAGPLSFAAWREPGRMAMEAARGHPGSAARAACPRARRGPREGETRPSPRRSDAKHPVVRMVRAEAFALVEEAPSNDCRHAVSFTPPVRLGPPSPPRPRENGDGAASANPRGRPGSMPQSGAPDRGPTSPGEGRNGRK